MDSLDEYFSKQLENEIFKPISNPFIFENENGVRLEPKSPPKRQLKDCANYHSINVKDGQQIEHVMKCVGPIWGNYEAAAKVRRYMETSGMKNWVWNGHWNSEGGTSYAYFERKINN